MLKSIDREHFVNTIPNYFPTTRDCNLNHSRYQKSGVPEYWTNHPREKKVEKWFRQHGPYQNLPSSHGLQLTIIDGVTVRLAEVS